MVVCWIIKAVPQLSNLYHHISKTFFLSYHITFQIYLRFFSISIFQQNSHVKTQDIKRDENKTRCIIKKCFISLDLSFKAQAIALDIFDLAILNVRIIYNFHISYHCSGFRFNCFPGWKTESKFISILATKLTFTFTNTTFINTQKIVTVYRPPNSFSKQGKSNSWSFSTVRWI